MTYTPARRSFYLGAAAWLLLAPSTSAQMELDKVALKSRMSLATFGASFAEDSWGYVSPSQREYAIVGLSQGTAFVEITDPVNPVIVDIKLQPVKGRDMKVYQNYVYSSVDSGPTFIYDVDDIDSGVVTFIRTINAGSHNLALDEVSGFLYLAEGGPMDIYDLSDPENPVLVGGWPGQTHDAQVVTYTTGPYAGRQIAFVFAGFDGRVDIVDVTDKSNVFLVGQTSYPSASYTHQGWLSDDRQLLYVNDELDNIGRTTVIDVSDLANPFFVRDVSSGLAATDHNLYLRDGFIFAANYASGMRILDAADPTNPVHVGYFDTYPANDSAGFVGAWNVYPFFPSGNVIVSDRSGGLFVLDPTEALSQASSVGRNEGANVQSYTAAPPVIGTTWTGSVDLSLTGHSSAQLFIHSAPASIVLGGGQVVLIGGAPVTSLPAMPGPTATWNLAVPLDPALVGSKVYTQAIHFGGVMPFALSNAQDLRGGL